MSERFDGRAAWAKLTPEEQATIGHIALEALVAQVRYERARGRNKRIYHDVCFRIGGRLHLAAYVALAEKRDLLTLQGLPPLPSLAGPGDICCWCGRVDDGNGDGLSKILSHDQGGICVGCSLTLDRSRHRG
jgi:hypothetical protein